MQDWDNQIKGLYNRYYEIDTLFKTNLESLTLDEYIEGLKLRFEEIRLYKFLFSKRMEDKSKEKWLSLEEKYSEECQKFIKEELISLEERGGLNSWFSIKSGDWIWTCSMNPTQFSHWHNNGRLGFQTKDGSSHNAYHCGLKLTNEEYANWFLKNNCSAWFEHFSEISNQKYWTKYDKETKTRTIKTDKIEATIHYCEKGDRRKMTKCLNLAYMGRQTGEFDLDQIWLGSYSKTNKKDYFRTLGMILFENTLKSLSARDGIVSETYF